MQDNISIKHIPDGLNDPYRHYEYERYPRKPLEDDLVIIRAVVEPSRPEQRVFLKWSLNGVQQEPIRGRRVVDHVQKREYYQFELGRFKGKDSVEYLIEAEDERKTYRTKSFSFRVGITYRLTGFPQEEAKQQVQEAGTGQEEVQGAGQKKFKEDNREEAVQIEYINNAVRVVFNKTGLPSVGFGFSFENGYLKLLHTLMEFNKAYASEAINNSATRTSFTVSNENQYLYEDLETGNRVELIKKPFKFVIKDRDGAILLGSSSFYQYFQWTDFFDGALEFCIRYEDDSPNYLGFGERYDRLNQKGLSPDICVYNPYLEQEKRTYLPIPFFLTTDGYGLYIDSARYLSFDLGRRMENLLEIKARVSRDNPTLELYLFFGRPEKILKDYLSLTGLPELPPKWVFGPWMSANSWNSEEKVRKQIEYMKDLEIPATVLVIEAWSDEATFYIFNDAIYQLKPGGEGFSYRDFRFEESGKWLDPAGLVEFIHKNNLKLILWQIPVIKCLGEGEEENSQHDRDEAYVIEKKYCVMNEDGTPYRITDGWFANSLLIDFNNPEARDWWFNKRRYLYEELNVDGFKTDGGEFIFHDELVFADGKKGDEMRNLYPISYIKAYHDYTGKTTFSRSGFAGAQKYSLYWGGDQASSFSTMKRLLTAGLSLNLSGVPFWGWDIAGFSGEIPTAELFIRSTEMAAFCPVMQFHSENFSEKANWDRTPWNIAERTGDERVLEIYRFYANLRMNLLPYIYQEAMNAAENGEPLMRPLVFDYPDNPRVYNIEDQYLFGRSLLIAPVMEEGAGQREIYLPQGEWVDFWSGVKYSGGREIKYPCDLNRIPIFIKSGAVIPLNLNKGFEIGGSVGNELDRYQRLSFLLTGELNGRYEFKDDLGNIVILKCENGRWEAVFSCSKKESGCRQQSGTLEGSQGIEEVYFITANRSMNMGDIIKPLPGQKDLFLYRYRG